MRKKIFIDNIQKKNNLFILCAFFLGAFFFSNKQVYAQDFYKPTKEDVKALEDVIVEKYYTASDEDIKDTIGGKLAKGSVTYRIYLHLKPGYKLEMVYGYVAHPLFIETSTFFFNDTLYGHETGDKIVDKIINRHNVCLDSWLSMGATTNFHNGVLLKEDTDGTIIKGKEQLSKVDGMLYGDIFATAYYGTGLKFFKDSINPKRFYTENGAWANLKWAEGPTPTNKILIAQLTTDGKLSFELNVQIGTPTGGTLRYVAKKSEHMQDLNTQHQFEEVYFEKLSYNMLKNNR